MHSPATTPTATPITTTDLERQRSRQAGHMLERAAVHVPRIAWAADQVHEHQRRELAALLAHAMDRSPFHAGRLRGVDPGSSELAQFPVMTKADLVTRFDDVVTDPRLRRAALEEHVARLGDDLELYADEYVVLASGGSSGIRGLYPWHWTACTDFMLSILRRQVAAMLGAGAPPAGQVPPVGQVPLATVSGARPTHATCAFSLLFTDGPFAVTSIPADRPLGEIVGRLEEVRPAVLQGYPAVLVALAHERAAGRSTIAPQRIVSTSEYLDASASAGIEKAFGVPVANLFGSSEGLVGVSAPGSPWIELADDTAIVELVDDDDGPVPPGTPSSSVLVTNLMNPALPLIRYRLEDSMVALPAAAAAAAGSGHLMVRVVGRADEVLRYGRVRIAPAALRAVLAATPDVVDFCVTQTRGGLDVSVVGLDALDDDALAARLRAVLDGAGLDGAEVAVRRTASLERDALSAKARRFRPLLP